MTAHFNSWRIKAFKNLYLSFLCVCDWATICQNGFQHKNCLDYLINTGYWLDDLPSTMINRDGWQERDREVSVQLECCGDDADKDTNWCLGGRIIFLYEPYFQHRYCLILPKSIVFYSVYAVLAIVYQGYVVNHWM